MSKTVLPSENRATLSSPVLVFQPPRVRKRLILLRLIRLGISATLLVVVGNWLWQQQQVVKTHKGYVNGTLISLESPITGDLQLQNLKPGSPLRTQQVVGEVRNRRNPQLEGERQRLETAIQLADSQLAVVREKQQRRQALFQQFAQDQRSQKQFLGQYDAQRIDQARSELRQSQEAEQAAQREAKRWRDLSATGAVPRLQADQAGDRLRESKREVETRRAVLKQVEAEQRAAQAGLQLDAGRSMSYPELRMRELETELDDLALESSNIRVKLQSSRRELASLQNQLQLQTIAPLKSPATGVVWSVESRPGGAVKPVTENTTVLKVLDCQDTWVEAFVSEADLKYLKVGDRASVKVLGEAATSTDKPLTGRIRAIRAGVGRVQLGDVAVPPADQQRREIAVQIDLLQPLQSQGDATLFCGVGQTTEVTFQKPASSQQSGLLAGLKTFWRNSVIGAKP